MFSISFRKHHQNVHDLCFHHHYISSLYSFEGSFLKTQPNNRNILTQHMHNIVGYNMLSAFGHPLQRVAICWVLLAQEWKWFNFTCNICGCCMMLHLFSQVSVTVFHQGMHTSLIGNTQHVATCWNRVAKHVQHVIPNNIALCCNCLARLANTGP